MAAALRRGHRVNLVDDHRVRRRQHVAARPGAEQDVQRLRRRDDDMRRALSHLRALGLRRIAGAHEGPDLDFRQAHALQLGVDAGDRHFEVQPDVVRQRLQRRDIDDRSLIGQRPADLLAADHELVQRRHERGKRLAGSRRRSDQRVAAGLDRGPGLDLRRRRSGKCLLKPGDDCGMKSMHFCCPRAGGDPVSLICRPRGRATKSQSFQSFIARGGPESSDLYCTSIQYITSPLERQAAHGLGLRSCFGYTIKSTLEGFPHVQPHARSRRQAL